VTVYGSNLNAVQNPLITVTVARQLRSFHDVRTLDITPISFIFLCCVITFRVRRSLGEMCIGYGRLFVCLSVCLSLVAFPHYCTDPDVIWGNGRGAL